MTRDDARFDAMAAAALARNIRIADDQLSLTAAAEAGVCSYEDPARFHGSYCDVLQEFQPHSLHEHIVANSLAANLWSQRRYRGVESGLLDSCLREASVTAAPGESGATPARRLYQAFRPLSPAELTTLATLDQLHDALHRSTRANADRLAKARRRREAAAKKEAAQGR
ncbi:hypothetical protein [Paludibaculum fermentans]|uniref:Uncharacterized protein n=1 Tax=Paludibaculum fermentans TaxID=1473598 RepID=A0A7S7NM69_PALFE|nr:hypothetical protein [Paludibaculum fermentans]QOY86161.1 hypothetical protein IRI77_25570 [Paludibaculum fermentans]